MIPFAELELTEGATREEATSAYRRLAKTCHPDLHPGDPDLEAKFVQISTAYEQVVRHIEATQGRHPKAKLDGVERRPPDSVTVNRNVFLTVHEAMSGCTKHVDGVAARCDTCTGAGRLPTVDYNDCPSCLGTGEVINRAPSALKLHVECHDCGGKGRVRWIRCVDCGGFGTVDSDGCDVDIPPGSRDHDRLTVPGGANSRRDNVVGPVQITVVLRDAHFRLNGNDIDTSIQVDVWDAVLGCSVRVPSPSGARFKLDIPKETAAGTRFRIRGRGLNYTEETGDMVVTVQIRPMRLSEPGVAEAMAILRAANVKSEDVMTAK